MINVNAEMPKRCRTHASPVGQGAFGLLFISVFVTSLNTGKHKYVSSGSDAGVWIPTVAEEALQCSKHWRAPEGPSDLPSLQWVFY